MEVGKKQIHCIFLVKYLRFICSFFFKEIMFFRNQDRKTTSRSLHFDTFFSFVFKWRLLFSNSYLKLLRLNTQRLLGYYFHGEYWLECIFVNHIRKWIIFCFIKVFLSWIYLSKRLIQMHLVRIPCMRIFLSRKTCPKSHKNYFFSVRVYGFIYYNISICYWNLNE